jgi:hypothetical protein
MARIPEEQNDPSTDSFGDKPKPIRLNPSLELPGLEDIEVVYQSRVSPIRGLLHDFLFKGWTQLLLLQIGLVGGWFYHSATSGSSLNDNWRTIFTLCGIASFGFGAAALLYSRFSQTQSLRIREKYEDLRRRADRLVLRAGDLNKKSDVR